MQEVHVFSSKREGVSDIIKGIVKDLPASNELAKRFVITKITTQFRTSFLGIFWLILPSIISTLVWVYLNTTLKFNFDTGGVPYPLFVYASTTLWGVFTESLMTCKNWFSANFSIMSKVDIPKESIIISAFYETLFNTTIKFFVFLVLVGIFQPACYFSIHYFLMGIVTTFLFGFSIGLLLVPISVLVADVFSFINMVMPVLMLATPILYPIKKEGLAHIINMFNPLAAVIDTPRSLFFGTEILYPTSYVVYVSLSVVILFVGLIFQRVAMPHLVVKMS